MNNIGRNIFNIGYMDTLASGDSPVHKLDPRAKLLTTIAFIAAVVSFNKYEVSALVPFVIYPLALIYCGGLPSGYFIKKLLIVSPFALFIGAFNPLMDREVMLSVGTLGISGGWVSYFSILVRFALTVSAAFILVSLSGFNAVCESLVKLRVPKVFTVQLMFFYRYLFVLTDEAERMFRAWNLRAFSSKAAGFGVYAQLVGQLLLRTLDRAERIYLAMRCRGFDGRIRLVRFAKIGYREIFFVSGWITLFAVFRGYNIPLKIGTIITGLIR